MTYFGLHGFLGLPSDMELFLPKGSLCPHLFEEPFLRPIDEFVEAFASFVRKVNGERILVGYSMGGRLALEVLARFESLFDKAMIISANPFQAEEGRLKKDLLWGSRFLTEPWDELINSWESQPLFKGKMKRQEEEFNRANLAKALDLWSLARQEGIKTESLSLPILWVTGGEDLKYKRLAEAVVLTHPFSKKVEIEGAGHRIFADAPESLKNLISQF